MPVYFPGNGLPAGVKPVGYTTSLNRGREEASIRLGKQGWTIDDLEPIESGTVAWSGNAMYGLTFFASPRAPQVKKPTENGLQIVGPVNTDGSTNQYYEVLLPDLSEARVAPRSISLRVYSPDWSAVDQISIYFGTASYTKFFVATWSGTANGQSFGSGVAGKAGWRILWKARADCIATGAPDIAAVEFIAQKMRVYSVLGKAADVTFDELRYDADDVPTLAIDFDDAHRTVHSHALPVLEALGIKATIAVIPDKVGTTNFMSWPQLREWVSLGHACGPHGVKGALNSLTDYLTIQDAVEDVQWTIQRLLDEGCDQRGSVYNYTWAQGEYNWGGTYKSRELVDALLALGIKSGRSTAFPQFFNTRAAGADDAQRLVVPIIGHTWSPTDEAANINAILDRIDYCAKYKYSGRLVFHIIEAAPTVGTQITLANLQLLLNRAAYWVVRGKMRVVLSHEQLIVSA